MEYDFHLERIAQLEEALISHKTYLNELLEDMKEDINSDIVITRSFPLEFKWELLNKNHSEVRAKVFGGWIICGSSGGYIFISDPYHKWKVEKNEDNSN